MAEHHQHELHAALRQEIVESQKSQADFLKWKLIAVAAVSSVALGVHLPDGKVADSVRSLLCLVPLICAYVDLISLHIMIRIMTIGIFLRRSGDLYENFTFEVREKAASNPFIFEAVALHGSSMVFSALIFLLGWTGAPNASLAIWVANGYMIAGLFGVFVTAFSWLFYNSRIEKVLSTSEQVFKTLGLGPRAASSPQTASPRRETSSELR